MITSMDNIMSHYGSETSSKRRKRSATTEDITSNIVEKNKVVVSKSIMNLLKFGSSSSFQKKRKNIIEDPLLSDTKSKSLASKKSITLLLNPLTIDQTDNNKKCFSTATYEWTTSSDDKSDDDVQLNIYNNASQSSNCYNRARVINAVGFDSDDEENFLDEDQSPYVMVPKITGQGKFGLLTFTYISIPRQAKTVQFYDNGHDHDGDTDYSKLFKLIDVVSDSDDDKDRDSSNPDVRKNWPITNKFVHLPVYKNSSNGEDEPTLVLRSILDWLPVLESSNIDNYQRRLRHFYHFLLQCLMSLSQTPSHSTRKAYNDMCQMSLQNMANIIQVVDPIKNHKVQIDTIPSITIHILTVLLLLVPYSSMDFGSDSGIKKDKQKMKHLDEAGRFSRKVFRIFYRLLKKNSLPAQTSLQLGLYTILMYTKGHFPNYTKIPETNPHDIKLSHREKLTKVLLYSLCKDFLLLCGKSTTVLEKILSPTEISKTYSEHSILYNVGNSTQAVLVDSFRRSLIKLMVSDESGILMTTGATFKIFDKLGDEVHSILSQLQQIKDTKAIQRELDKLEQIMEIMSCVSRSLMYLTKSIEDGESNQADCLLTKLLEILQKICVDVIKLSTVVAVSTRRSSSKLVPLTTSSSLRPTQIRWANDIIDGSNPFNHIHQCWYMLAHVSDMRFESLMPPKDVEQNQCQTTHSIQRIRKLIAKCCSHLRTLVERTKKDVARSDENNFEAVPCQVLSHITSENDFDCNEVEDANHETNTNRSQQSDEITSLIRSRYEEATSMLKLL